jgi:deazaflavin-dependent oxidoreductase (nitroreductase family)
MLRQRVLNSPVFVAVAKRILPRLDRRLLRLSRGRFSLTPRQARVLLLTTIGRRSGRRYATPLIYTVDGDGYFVVASNWGEAGNPAWVLNLMADPLATIELGGRQYPVKARVLAGTERTEVWQRLVRSWPLYADLAARAGDRELPVVRLSPA